VQCYRHVEKQSMLSIVEQTAACHQHMPLPKPTHYQSSELTPLQAELAVCHFQTMKVYCHPLSKSGAVTTGRFEQLHIG
jgi:hypothetical protein